MAKPLVLVLEDDVLLAKLIGEVCRMMGLESKLTFSVGLAREALAERTPDLVILDLMLPVDRGETLFAELQTWKSPPPVIIASADWVAMSKIEGGIHLRKPYRLADLQALISSTLGDKR